MPFKRNGIPCWWMHIKECTNLFVKICERANLMQHKRFCKINNMVILNHLMKPTKERTQKNIEILQVNSSGKFSFKVIKNMFRLCFGWKIPKMHDWKQTVSSLNVSNNLGFDPLGIYLSKLYRSLYSLKRERERLSLLAFLRTSGSI